MCLRAWKGCGEVLASSSLARHRRGTSLCRNERRGLRKCAATTRVVTAGAHNGSSKEDSLLHMPQVESERVKVLGGQDFIYSQKSGVEEDLFKGKTLGVDADIATGDFRFNDFRTLANINAAEWHVPERFSTKVAVHFAKNLLMHKLNGARVPLILAIWGEKGCGKSFNLEVCCQLMGVEPIVMSAGELEDETAGEPSKLVRERYRRAARLTAQEGKLSCLIINDIDAGLGRHGETQVTVNNQSVQGSLMALCDDPETVSTGGVWESVGRVPRIPIIVTGNDLSRMYAPLIRDGRMDKFYWNPNREERLQMIQALYQDDGSLSDAEIVAFHDEFSAQSMDFFGAVRARLYDDSISMWAFQEPLLKLQGRIGGLQRGNAITVRHLLCKKIGLLDLLHAGRALAKEQDYVESTKLSKEYMRLDETPRPTRKYSEARSRFEPQFVMKTEAMLEAEQRARENLWLANEAAREAERERRQSLGLPEFDEECEEDTGPAWGVIDAIDAKELIDDEGYRLVDCRSARDYAKESSSASISVPSIVVGGSLAAPTVSVREGFLEEFQSHFPDLDSKVLLCGGSGEQCSTAAMAILMDAGYESVLEVEDGYAGWDRYWTPAGKSRKAGPKWKLTDPEGSISWAASN